MFKKFFPCIMIPFLVMFSSFSFGNVIHVPNDFNTIQAGIDVAQKGDTVLVDEGTYFENIKFRGKSIIVASHFILDEDPDHILKTIINGSKFTNHDSASCVMFHGEDSSAVLQGFTLTKGEGTIYILSNLSTTTKYDGKVTIEGGGVFFNESKATVKNNLIINNQATGISGYNYNGGGGISSFCGNPKIYNNVIMNNRANSANGAYGYAAGIVFNESNGIIRNNIIYNNRTTGSGALFLDINRSAIVENNTIVSNICESGAAGIANRTPNSVFRNNIVWGNNNINNQILGIGSDDIFEYCCTDQNFNNQSTIFNKYPEFSDTNFTLNPNSPCVDTGNPDMSFNDIEDIAKPGYAKIPSLGNTRNDIGAYGGPYAGIIPDIYYENISLTQDQSFPSLTVNDSSTIECKFTNLSTVTMKIDSITVNNKKELFVQNNIISQCKPMQSCIVEILWKPLQAGDLRDTLKIYHNLTEVTNPAIVIIRGKANAATGISDGHSANIPQKFELRQNFPNPFNPKTHIQYSIPNKEFVSLKIFDTLGREINTLINKVQHAGNYELVLDGSHLSSGLYFYYLKAGKFSDKKKLMLLK